MIQKILATLMTYSISLQLILGGIPVAMLTSTSAHANKCATGLEWNAILNRCLSSLQASQVQSASARCQKISDKAAQSKCYTDALSQQVVDAERKGNITGAGSVNTKALPIILAMATLISSVATLKYLSKDCKGATSAYLMAGASAAIFAGEILSGKKFRKKAAEAAEEFNKIVKGSGSNEGSEVQSEALAAMIKKEDAVIEAASTKKTFYTIALAAYAGAGVMAAIESIKYKAGTLNPTTTAKTQLLYVCKKSTVASEKETLALNSNPVKPVPGIESTHKAGSLSVQKPKSGVGKNKTSQDKLYADNTSEYLKAFFELDQKVTFQTFYNTPQLKNIKSLASLYQATTDIARFRSGDLFSSSVDEYKDTELASLELEKEMTPFELKLMAFGVALAQQFTIQNAEASDLVEGFGMILGLGAVGYFGTTMLMSKSSKITKLFLHPYTRTGLSTVMTAVSESQRSHMDTEKKNAEKRKAFIEKLQLQVEAAGNGFGSCTQEQRNSDMSKPHCFCYLQGGAINTARVKSATCKTFFGSGLAKNMARPASATNAREKQACTTPNAAVIDESCSCRRTNTCTSTPKTGFTSTGVGPAAIDNMNEIMDGINNGTLQAESIKPEAMLAKAAALNKKRVALLTDPKNKDVMESIKKADALVNKTMDQVAGQVAGIPSLMNSSFGGSGGGALGSGSPQEEIKKLQEEFKKDMSKFEPGSIGGSENQLGAAGDDFSLDAVSGGGVTIDGDEKLAEVMDTNFDSTGSDINSNSDANIFQILTYRYQRSAMRRLFGGEAILPADKAIETEIAE